MPHRLPLAAALETEMGLTIRSCCNWETITVFCQHHPCFFKSPVPFLFVKESVIDMNTQNQALVSTRLRALGDAEGGATL